MEREKTTAKFPQVKHFSCAFTLAFEVGIINTVFTDKENETKMQNHFPYHQGDFQQQRGIKQMSGGVQKHYGIKKRLQRFRTNYRFEKAPDGVAPISKTQITLIRSSSPHGGGWWDGGEVRKIYTFFFLSFVPPSFSHSLPFFHLSILDLSIKNILKVLQSTPRKLR